MNNHIISRRDFLLIAAKLMTLGLSSGCTSPIRTDGSQSERPETKEARMKLSLSTRVAESFTNKEKASLTITELIALAQLHGYEAICMRASQVGVHSSLERVRQISHQIQGAALNVSMVTGDFKVPMNNQFGPDGLRAITPYLNLAQSLGADLIRICMKKDDDIPWAQRASDEAIERGIRLAHQAHCASLFETIDHSLTVLKKVNRNNFGIIYEPANWMLAGENYGLETIKRLQPYIFNVYVQNHRLNPNGKARVTTWGRGEVKMVDAAKAPAKPIPKCW